MWLAALAALALLATGCASVSSPQGWAGPLLADGTLFVSTERGKMAALDPADFSTRWVFPPDTEEGKRFDLEAIYGTPAVAGRMLLFGAYDGNVYALDTVTGELAWSQPFETDGPIIGGVAVVDSTVFVGSDDGKLYALDAGDGSQKLEPFDTGDSIWATPLFDGVALYVPSVNGKLYALDKTLEPVWERPFEADAGLITDPVLADADTVLVGGIDRRLYAVSASTGEEEWRFEADNWFWGRPLVIGGKVYAPNLDNNVYALDAATGEPAWRKPLEARAQVRSSPLLVGDVLVIADKDGNVYGVDPATGVLKWREPTALAKTVLADPLLLGGKALMVTQGGSLFHIDPADGGSSSVQVRPP